MNLIAGSTTLSAVCSLAERLGSRSTREDARVLEWKCLKTGAELRAEHLPDGWRLFFYGRKKADGSAAESDYVLHFLQAVDLGENLAWALDNRPVIWRVLSCQRRDWQREDKARWHGEVRRLREFAQRISLGTV